MSETATIIDVVEAVKAVELYKHQGFYHSKFDWWRYDAMQTSPRTCERCLDYHNNRNHWRGDQILIEFPNHVHVAVNQIHVMVHPHCRCNLWWLFRTEEVHEAYEGPFMKAR